MKLQIFAVATAAVLAGCVTKEPKPDETAITVVQLSQADIALVKSSVLKKERDPSSVRFGPRMLAGRRPSGDIAVCGTVNGKNGFGAYTGMKPFQGELSGGSFKLAGIADFAGTYCKSIGLNIVSD